MTRKWPLVTQYIWPFVVISSNCIMTWPWRQRHYYVRRIDNESATFVRPIISSCRSCLLRQRKHSWSTLLLFLTGSYRPATHFNNLNSRSTLLELITHVHRWDPWFFLRVLCPMLLGHQQPLTAYNRTVVEADRLFFFHHEVHHLQPFLYHHCLY